MLCTALTPRFWHEGHRAGGAAAGTSNPLLLSPSGSVPVPAAAWRGVPVPARGSASSAAAFFCLFVFSSSFFSSKWQELSGCGHSSPFRVSSEIPALGTDGRCRCLSVGTALSGKRRGWGWLEPRLAPRLLLKFANESRNEDVSFPVHR